MRISAGQYAKTLYEMTAGKSHAEINDVIAKFVKLLNQKRQLKLASKVAVKFSEIYNQENGIVEAEVTSREKLSGQLVDKLSSFIKEKYQAKKVIINNKIDLDIKGGIIIKVGDEILDGSIQARLNNLRNILIK